MARRDYLLLELHLHDKHDLDQNPKHYHMFTQHLLHPNDPRVSNPDLVVLKSQKYECPVQGFIALPDPQQGGYPVPDRYVLFGSKEKANLDKFEQKVDEMVLEGIVHTWNKPDGKKDFGHFGHMRVHEARTSWDNDIMEPWCKELGAGPRIPPPKLDTPATRSKSSSRSPSTSRR